MHNPEARQVRRSPPQELLGLLRGMVWSRSLFGGLCGKPSKCCLTKQTHASLLERERSARGPGIQHAAPARLCAEGAVEGPQYLLPSGDSTWCPSPRGKSLSTPPPGRKERNPGNATAVGSHHHPAMVRLVVVRGRPSLPQSQGQSR